MRGHRETQGNFVCLIDVEQWIAADHPIRTIKRLVDEVLADMSGHFDEIYAREGRPSILPETLLKGKVLQALYTVRSDRQLLARLQTDLLFRWSVDLPLDRSAFDASSYSKNQERLLRHEVAGLFFSEVVELARRHGWVSDDHFSVDGTLIEAWASMKSFRPKHEPPAPGAGNGWSDFKGHKRSNDTHASATDPEAKLLRKGPGQEAKLCFAGHATMENRHGLCVLFEVHPAVGAPESTVAVEQMIELRNRGFDPQSVGADKNDHDRTFVEGLRAQGIKPHPALRQDRARMGIICRTAHALSQKCRKQIEEIFGWTKTTGCFRKSRYRGVECHGSLKSQPPRPVASVPGRLSGSHGGPSGDRSLDQTNLPLPVSRPIKWTKLSLRYPGPPIGRARLRMVIRSAQRGHLVGQHLLGDAA